MSSASLAEIFDREEENEGYSDWAARPWLADYSASLGRIIMHRVHGAQSVIVLHGSSIINRRRLISDRHSPSIMHTASHVTHAPQ